MPIHQSFERKVNHNILKSEEVAEFNWKVVKKKVKESENKPTTATSSFFFAAFSNFTMFLNLDTTKYLTS